MAPETFHHFFLRALAYSISASIELRNSIPISYSCVDKEDLLLSHIPDSLITEELITLLATYIHSAQ